MDKLIQIREAFQKIEITLTDRQTEQFLSYYKILIEKNKYMNLT